MEKVYQAAIKTGTPARDYIDEYLIDKVAKNLYPFVLRSPLNTPEAGMWGWWPPVWLQTIGDTVQGFSKVCERIYDTRASIALVLIATLVGFIAGYATYHLTLNP